MTTIDSTIETPTLALDEIRHHPANPRRNAVADEAMVESIRAQGINEPLMVAPGPDGEGWILVDGHRRWSGAGLAGLDRVPVNPRYDLVTEAQQIEVMVVTGLQKELLTPVEEAAAYEQLALIGMDDAAIAKATGYGVRRVRDRIKLNAASEKVRESLHAGEVSLTDVAALEEFADDPGLTKQLEEALGTPNFRQRLHSARAAVEHRKTTAAEIAALVENGGRQVERVPGGAGAYVFADDETRAEHRGAVGLFNFNEGANTPEDHDAGCLLFVLPEYDFGRVHPMCASPQKHPEYRHHPRPDAPATEPVESEWEKNRAAREAEHARLAAASMARLEWLLGHFGPMFPAKSHQDLASAARALLPLLLLDERDAPDGDILRSAFDISDRDAAAEHAEALTSATTTKVLTGLGNYLAALVADQLDAPEYWIETSAEARHRLDLWDWLTSAGYPLSDVDVEIRARLESKLLELTNEDDA